MNLTIKSKLQLLLVSAVAGLAILSIAHYFSNMRLSEMLAAADERSEQARMIESANRNLSAIMLAAMDVIVDKDEGRVSPERMTIFKENFAGLSDARREMVRYADTQAEKALTSEADAGAARLEKAVYDVLVVAVTNRAPPEKFAEIDDLLDDLGGAVEKSLVGMMDSIGDEEKAAVQVRNQSMDDSIKTTVYAFLAMSAIGAAFIYFLSRSIIDPLRDLTRTTRAVAEGDYAVTVPHADAADEVGELARTLDFFKQQLQRVRQLEGERENQKRRSDEERRSALNALAGSFEGSVGKVVGTVSSAVTQLRASSGELAGTAARTSAQATDVARSAEAASANVQAVASASEELSASINEIAEQVENSMRVAAKAESEAAQTTVQVESLSEAVGRIGDIVNLINSIATQTNLLALNATIEAARAGDAGKGFAVVANEVKALAGQTAKATEEISSHIGAVQVGTTNAVSAIRDISTVVVEMSRISAAVAAAVQEQTAATSEIARAVEQAAARTGEVTDNIGVVERAAGDTGTAAGHINSSAQELSRQADFLKDEVRRFLDQVRSDRMENAA